MTTNLIVRFMNYNRELYSKIIDPDSLKDIATKMDRDDVSLVTDVCIETFEGDRLAWTNPGNEDLHVWTVSIGDPDDEDNVYASLCVDIIAHSFTVLVAAMLAMLQVAATAEGIPSD